VIVFDLHCGNAHVFEAWFGSQADYDDQHGRGLVACPVCGDGEVSKAPMAPRIATTDKSAPDPKAVMKAMMMAQRHMLSKSEDVGERFAQEARAIHSGDSEERPDEATKLVEEGVPVAPLPFPVRDTARDN
jgi:hypothetical protein